MKREREREAKRENEERKRKGYNLRHFSLLMCIEALWLFLKNEITLYKLFYNLLFSVNIYLCDLSTSVEINLTQSFNCCIELLYFDVFSILNQIPI